MEEGKNDRLMLRCSEVRHEISLARSESVIRSVINFQRRANWYGAKRFFFFLSSSNRYVRMRREDSIVEKGNETWDNNALHNNRWGIFLMETRLATESWKWRGGMIIRFVSETIDNCIVMEYYYKLFQWNCIVILEMWKNWT